MHIIFILMSKNVWNLARMISSQNISSWIMTQSTGINSHQSMSKHIIYRISITEQYFIAMFSKQHWYWVYIPHAKPSNDGMDPKKKNYYIGPALPSMFVVEWKITLLWMNETIFLEVLWSFSTLMILGPGWVMIFHYTQTGAHFGGDVFPLLTIHYKHDLFFKTAFGPGRTSWWFLVRKSICLCNCLWSAAKGKEFGLSKHPRNIY